VFKGGRLISFGDGGCVERAFFVYSAGVIGGAGAFAPWHHGLRSKGNLLVPWGRGVSAVVVFHLGKKIVLPVSV
jgi:hypothetical protein